MEGHTRQWGLCGHLSVTDKSRRRRVGRKQRRSLNVRVFGVQEKKDLNKTNQRQEKRKVENKEIQKIR